MAKGPGDLVLDGECENCGLPGIIGLTCSECGGQVIGFTDALPVARDESDQYDEKDIADTNSTTLSLEDLAEAEAVGDDETF